MANHVLSLEIPTVTNSCIFKIVDTSVYSALVGLHNPRLEIVVHGYTNTAELPFVPQSSPTLTACDLDIQIENCDSSFVNLPDGIYGIKYIMEEKELQYLKRNQIIRFQSLFFFQKTVIL